jgi:hypothetical protein
MREINDTIRSRPNTRAREVGYRKMADDLIDIADGSAVPSTEADGNKDKATDHDGDAVQRDRLRVDTRKWLLSKALPMVYGDKVISALTGRDGGPIELAPIDPAMKLNAELLASLPGSEWMKILKTPNKADANALQWDRKFSIRRTFRAHLYVHSVRFSPDGECVLGGTTAPRADLCDADSGQPLRAFKDEYKSVTHVAFSPDGKRIVSNQRGELRRFYIKQIESAHANEFSKMTNEELEAFIRESVRSFGFAGNAASARAVRHATTTIPVRRRGARPNSGPCMTAGCVLNLLAACQHQDRHRRAHCPCA